MNSNYPHPIIAREGWVLIGGSFLLAALWTSVAGFGFVAALLWILFLLVTQFFRDPPRTVPTIPDVVLSPADGQIVKVEKTIDPFTNKDAILISVFMNIFNVHCQRSPVEGTVEDVQYYPGKFLNADLDKASTENERNAVVMRLKDGQAITVVQVAGLVARRILCYVQKGDELSRGERYGFIRFGSRLDVYLPTDAEPCVTIGEKVLGTETILAKLQPQSK
ncbi:MAG: phosphatidylserine decarboxylase [Candidatus Aphodousia sp.]|nr:phosphatidylserine decarboxylase [Sutterella sp.]MDY2899713.1 phosphatidylserine decarboxylase [Candidatus Aphodousia sp.]